MEAEELYQKGLQAEMAAEQVEGSDTASQTSCQQAAAYRKQAAGCWKQAAEQGHAMAQYRLGCYYYHHSGAGNKNNRAFYWYSRSAAQGVREAQYELGWCYAYGAGCVRDVKQARVWFEKSAGQGYPLAAFTLGNWFRDRRNYKKAIRWYQENARLALYPAPAEFELGLIYDQKLKDVKQAVYWYTKAAEDGLAEQERLLAHWRRFIWAHSMRMCCMTGKRPLYGFKRPRGLDFRPLRHG